MSKFSIDISRFKIHLQHSNDNLDFFFLLNLHLKRLNKNIFKLFDRCKKKLFQIKWKVRHQVEVVSEVEVVLEVQCEDVVVLMTGEGK